ncbi:MAG: GPR endopeptidase [Clostridia bacterium]|nr:GPR endopeptidase [Clostridia bacterium]
MNIRTDLVLEQQEGCDSNLSGIEKEYKKTGNATLSIIKICDDEASNILQKPKGTYCTVEFPRLDFVCDTADIINATVKALKKVFKNNITNALVVGLGNTDITPDALGPFVADRVLATRHLGDALKHDLGLDDLKSVCCLAPNVLGKTGIESYDLITATTKKIKPDLIIAIDALAARDPSRLCRTIQLSDSGICPGAGVNNSRKELSKKTIGIPIIAVGIPTVIDANSFFENTKTPIENMMVTPKEIDLLVEKSAQILARAINIFLQPELDIDVIESLT